MFNDVGMILDENQFTIKFKIKLESFDALTFCNIGAFVETTIVEGWSTW